MRTAKSCGSDAPGPASSLREDAQATVSTKPGHREEREVSRKTIARGMPGCSGVTVVTTLVCLFFYTRGCGRIARPAFPAPSDIKGTRNSCTARANSRRGNAKVCLMNAKVPHSHASSPGLTGRPSIPETPENNREAAAYWIVRSSRTTTVVWKTTKQLSTSSLRACRPNRTSSTPTLPRRCGRWLRRSERRSRACGCWGRRGSRRSAVSSR